MIAALLALAVVAHVPTVRMDDEHGRPSTVGASTGFDDALLPVTVGYATGLRPWQRPLTLGATLTMPMLRPDFGDLRGSVYAELDVNRELGWMVRVAHGWSVIGTRNDAFSAVGMAARGGVTVGWSARRFAIGGELVAGLTAFTHVHTTTWGREIGGLPFTRATFGAPAWSLETGLRAGVLLGRVELALRAGFDRKGRLNLAIPPVYATLGVAVRWGADEWRDAVARGRAKRHGDGRAPQ